MPGSRHEDRRKDTLGIRLTGEECAVLAMTPWRKSPDMSATLESSSITGRLEVGRERSRMLLVSRGGSTGSAVTSPGSSSSSAVGVWL